MKYILKVLVFLLVLGLGTAAHADVYTASRACVRVSCRDGVGSGIVVGSDAKYYYAITNAHVATEQTAKIEFFDAGKITRADAVLVQRDAALDLAVYKIDTKGYNPAIIPLDPNFSMKEGDVLCTIGHPLGKFPTCFFCTYKTNDPTFGLMFTPPPAQGRSGSPLLAPDGSRVVGIVYGYTTEDMIGLAIPARVVASFLSGAVNGEPRKTRWTPPRDGVVRFTAARSILQTSEDEDDEYTPILPEAEPEPEPAPAMSYQGTLYLHLPEIRPQQPQPLFPGLRQRLNQPQQPQPQPLFPQPRPLFWRFRQPQESPIEIPVEVPQQRMEPTFYYEPEVLTGLKIQVGDVHVELKDPPKPEEKPATPAPPKPPHHKPPHQPPHYQPRPLPPRPAPGFFPRPVPPDHPVPPPPHVGDLVESGAVVLTAAKAEKPETEKPEAEKPEAEKPEAEKPEAEKPEAEAVPVILTQYIYPGYPPSTCPGGNCPIQQTAPQTLPPVVTPPSPVPAQIVGQEPKKEKPAQTPAPAPAKETAPAKESQDVTQAQFLRSIDSARDKIQVLESRVTKLEADTGYLREKVEKIEVANAGQTEGVENAGLFNRPVPQAIENGLTGAGRAIGEAVTLEVGEDVKATLATVNESVEASTEALTEAAGSFTATMTATQETLTATQETLAAVQECTRATWMTLAVLVAVLSAFIIMKMVTPYLQKKEE